MNPDTAIHCLASQIDWDNELDTRHCDASVPLDQRKRWTDIASKPSALRIGKAAREAALRDEMRYREP